MPPDHFTQAERDRFYQMYPTVTDAAEYRAAAVVNHGRWIARCPRRSCFNALKITPGQEVFHCTSDEGDGCQLLAPIEWPEEAQGIWAELSRRPVPATRNWAPAGHPQAIASGHPDGQSLADLRAETDRYLNGG